MSGFDRAELERKLLDTGLWFETDDGRLLPTDTLWENRLEPFTEYNARDLHNLLSDEDNQI